MKLSCALPTACLIGSVFGGTNVHAQAVTGQRFSRRLPEPSAALRGTIGMRAVRPIATNASNAAPQLTPAVVSGEIVSGEAVSGETLSANASQVASEAPSQPPTVSPTADPHDEPDGWPGVMFVLVGGLFMHCLINMRQRYEADQSAARARDTDMMSRPSARPALGPPPEFPAWDALETADVDAPPIEPMCPISLQDWPKGAEAVEDGMHEPVRIRLAPPSHDDKSPSYHYNNKCYTYEAIKECVTAQWRQRVADYKEPTTRQHFSINDLRRAHPNTRIEGESWSTEMTLAFVSAPSADV